LIKILADEFKIKIEMRQIGARQESGKLGGIGICGRELCCSSFMHQFQSVTTNAARVQQLSLNPQKLAGLCNKLKCCLNYEAPVYQEILNSFPNQNIALKTKKGIASHVKSDIFKNLMWYSYENTPSSLMAVPIENVKKVQDMNAKGIIPDNLESFASSLENKMEDDKYSKEDISKLAD
jgi:cell fate regulator YaaT (PSP1 superfamily)